MSNKQYIALPGGLTCKSVNPFYADETECRNESGSEYIDRRKKYMDFEANNPVLALTEVMPEGETFEGEEIYQLYDHDYNQWQDGNRPNDVSWENFNKMWRTTRIAIKPLKAKHLVKFPSDSSDRDWTEDFEHENGNYTCICSAGCKQHFTGHKRRVLCKACDTQKPLLDVVESKEETLNVAASKNIERENISVSDRLMFLRGAEFGANWQQSQSIEGIVGFVLEWVAERASQKWIAGQLISSATKHDILNMKSDIIKELKNGK